MIRRRPEPQRSSPTAEKTTTARIPDDLAETAEVVARGRGIRVNTLVVGAIRSEIDSVRQVNRTGLDFNYGTYA